MIIHKSDKIIAWLALLSGLSISAVAIYYSVAGLVAIFAAAAIPIIVMGVVLEVGKLAATVWLKQNWFIAPRFLKTYLLIAIIVLMIITSMGIFGFLSKAHLDQAVPTGDVAAKVSLLDEKIRTERDNIETARTALKQMDSQVDQMLSRTDNEKGAERAVQIRRQQQAERGRLQKDISDAQSRIAKLNEERAPIAAELRKVEAEVGPIKYVAALIYGDNPDSNLLERAVRWVIIIIVLVFDPLAVILLLASQYSFAWFRQKEDEDKEMASDLFELEKLKDEPIEEPIEENPDIKLGTWPFPAFVGRKEENLFDVIKNNEKVQEAPYHPGYEDVAIKDDAGMNDSDPKFDEKKPLEEWNEMIAEAERAVAEENEKEEQDIIDSAPHTEKEAMSAWKKDNPDSSLKLQRQLLEKGVIKELPWFEYLKPRADFTEDQEAALEAARWAEERLNQNKQEVSWMEHDEQGNQIKKTKEGYQQNAEQSERTIWQRIQDAKK